MKCTDFKLLKCPECGRTSIYYAPPLSKNEELRKSEIEEYEEMGVEIDENFSFKEKCTCNDGYQTELPFDKYPELDCAEILGNILEDDNHHNLTGIGYLFIDMMKKAGISEKERESAIRELLISYSENHTLKY